MKRRTLNIFFYGPLENETEKAIHGWLEDRGDIVYLRWPSPFESFRIEDVSDICTRGKVATDGKEVFRPDNLFREDRRGYIVIEHLHILAHSGSNPEGFYRGLLSACNFYTLRHGINFILSCAKLPVVFYKENACAHLWRFISCIGSAAKEREKAENGGDLSHLRLEHPHMEDHDLFKLREYLKLREKHPETIIDELRALVDRLTESTSLYCSNTYVQDRLSGQQLLTEDIGRIRDHLRAIIIGQDEAIDRVADAILLAYHSLTSDQSPKGVFLFVGPSGVGKTRVCQEMARMLPGYRFLQINLSEHNDRAAVNKLIGLGRGYEESEPRGLLTEPIRLFPRHIVLFDELDHAHPSVLRLFYKIFEGEITDGRGRKISFRDAFIVMTTNKGRVDQVQDRSELRRAIEQKLIEEPQREDRRIFDHPFLGRVQSIVQFKRLLPYDMLRIGAKHFSERIIIPYHKQYGVNVRFESMVPEPQLLKNGILSLKSLFFELWALWALQTQEQGARRLFQLMEEYLIQPIELFRIKYQKHLKEGFGLVLSFSPFWPAIMDYDNGVVLLIDDEEKEKQALLEQLGAKVLDVHWKDFSDIEAAFGQIKPYAILLDLLKEGQMVGKDVLIHIGNAGEDAPVCIYSALPEGPQLDQIKSSLWAYGISRYIGKRSAQEPLRKAIYGAILEHCLNQKVKAKPPIKGWFLEAPIYVEEKAAHFVLKEMSG